MAKLTKKRELELKFHNAQQDEAAARTSGNSRALREALDRKSDIMMEQQEMADIKQFGDPNEERVVLVGPNDRMSGQDVNGIEWENGRASVRRSLAESIAKEWEGYFIAGEEGEDVQP